MNLPLALFVELLAGVALGAGRSLGVWAVDRIRLQAEEGVPVWPLRLPREHPGHVVGTPCGKVGCDCPCPDCKPAERPS